MVPIMSPNLFAGNFETEPEWSSWLNTEGASGVEPPDDAKRLREIQNEIYAEPDPQKQLALHDEVFTIHANNMWELGILEWDSEMSFSYIKNNRLGKRARPDAGRDHPVAVELLVHKELEPQRLRCRGRRNLGPAPPLGESSFLE